MPISIVFRRPRTSRRTPDGNADLGITGEDIVAESGSHVNALMELGRQVPLGAGAEGAEYADASALAGKRIATPLPELTKAFFAKFETEAMWPTKISCISGSVEAACGLGLADGIVDLVETGTTCARGGAGGGGYRGSDTVRPRATRTRSTRS